MRLQPANPDTWRRLGHLRLSVLDHPEEAVRDFRAAYYLDPVSPVSASDFLAAQRAVAARKKDPVIGRAAVAAAATLALLAGPASAAVRESTIQDDARLLDGSAAERRATLDEMKALGADRVRVTVIWRRLAPAPDSRARPGFDASDPAAYPEGVFADYDAVARDATARGLGVNFDVTGPAPLWATRRPPRSDVAATLRAVALRSTGSFDGALGRRYSATWPPCRASPTGRCGTSPTSRVG